MHCNKQHLYSITSQKLKGQLMMDSRNFIADLHRDFVPDEHAQDQYDFAAYINC
jgi:hypothetical protein